MNKEIGTFVALTAWLGYRYYKTGAYKRVKRRISQFKK